jgi:hypothetical protein
MTTHSHSTWDFGQPITEDLICEIVDIINANTSFCPAFAICSRVDHLAYVFGINKNINIQNSISLSDPQLYDQLTEIYNRVKEKLSQNL